MKVKISNMVWIDKKDLSPIDAYFIKNDCTIVPKKGPDWMPNRQPVKVYVNDADKVGIPKSYYVNVFKQKSECKKIEELIEIPEHRLVTKKELKATLYPEQKEVTDKILDYFRSREFAGGILSAHVGAGKSLMCFHIANELEGPALILAHKTPLLDQLQRNLERFLPDAKIGRIQGDKCDYQGKDFVFATLQSLMNEGSDKYPADVFNYFKTVIQDECHVCGAEAFSTVIPKFNCRYILGLSGTARRADGCEDVFKFCIGEIIAKMSEKNRIIPHVLVRKTSFRHYNYDCDSKPRVVTMLASSQQRNQLIANDIIAAVKKGRKCLVMSERLDALSVINSMCVTYFTQNNLDYTTGFYIGNKKESELIEAAKANVVLATAQIAKEGIDIPQLDTLFLVTPMSDIEQAAGRITRPHPDKKHPIIVDYVDQSMKICQSSFNSRERFYRKLGCQFLGDQNGK